MPRAGAVAIGLFLGGYAAAESNWYFVKWLLGRCTGSDLGRRKTTVECAQTDYNRQLLDKCPGLQDFKPPWWAQGPLLQLYLAITCPAPKLKYISETITMRDGGYVQLDWAEKPGTKQNAPVLVVLHGIAGHSQERYVRRMVEVMRAEGWMVVVYNRRGHVVLDGDHISTEKTVQAGFSELEVELRSLSGGQLPPVSGVSGHSSSSKDYLSARSEMSPQNEGTVSGGPVEGVVVPDEADSERYHPATPGSDGPFSAEPPIAQGIVRVWPLYSDVEDMKEVVQHVRATQGPAARLFAVGFSAGSNCLAKYVGEMGKQCPLTAAASVANAFDIRLGLAYVQKHARLLDRMIAYNLQNLYAKCAKDIEKHAPSTVKAKAVKRCHSVRAIDTVISSQIYGIDVDTYYDSQSSRACMPHVAIPLLCLNAADDPLIDPKLGTMGAVCARKNDNVISVLTSHGGHLGWVTGWRRQWMCPAICEFLKAANELSLERES